MTTAEFEQVTEKLAELEDYLREQRRLALAVNHATEAGILEQALLMTIKAHAQCQLLLEVPEKWHTYEDFRADMIARQREAESHGFKPTMELLGTEPWPPEWKTLEAEPLPYGVTYNCQFNRHDKCDGAWRESDSMINVMVERCRCPCHAA